MLYEVITKNHDHGHDHSHGGESSKKQIIQLITGAVIFGAGILMSKLFELNIYAELAIFLVAYLILGGGVVLRALKNITKGQIFDENFLMSVATIGAFAIGDFPEAVAVMLFYQIGEYRITSYNVCYTKLLRIFNLSDTCNAKFFNKDLCNVRR